MKQKHMHYEKADVSEKKYTNNTPMCSRSRILYSTKHIQVFIRSRARKIHTHSINRTLSRSFTFRSERRKNERMHRKRGAIEKPFSHNNLINFDASQFAKIVENIEFLLTHADIFPYAFVDSKIQPLAFPTSGTFASFYKCIGANASFQWGTHL